MREEAPSPDPGPECEGDTATGLTRGEGTLLEELKSS